MASNQTDILISLNETDRSLQESVKELTSLEQNNLNLEKKIARTIGEIEAAESAYEKAKALRVAEQEKLDQEQQKIADRRKQLSSMGGAKSAKLVERELGIAKRITETLEQNVLNAIQVEENLESKKKTLEHQLEELRLKASEGVTNYQERSGGLREMIEKLKSLREENLKNLDERTAVLYKRVESRYKGDAIALAEAGACKSCFRSLPAQTFNQIMAGYNLIQCPGCSRISVFVPVSAEKSQEGESSENVANS